MNLSRITLLVSLVLGSLLWSSGQGALAQSSRVGISTVVLDAGHGGKDPGTVYGQYHEKDITLAVALRLGALIEENYPEVKVVYTRKTDVFVPLDQRGDIANKAGADLFMSIHVNASKGPTASGTETFVMGITKSAGNLDIAMRENDVITYEKDYSAKYQGYTPGSSESFIIFSLMQYSYLEQSMQLAQIVQQQYQKTTPLVGRGVKQAGFLVLWRTAMPSILTEVGFLSNGTDRAEIVTRKGQERLSRALFNAFSIYKTKAEGKTSYKLLDISDIVAQTGDGQTVNQNVPAAEVQAETVDVATAAETAPVVKEPQPAQPVRQEPARTQPVKETPKPAVSASDKGVIYRIQVCSSVKKIPLNDPTFKAYRNKVEERVIDGRYKYYVCPTTSYDEAVALQNSVRRTFDGAFIVAFKDGKPVPVSSVRK